MKKKFFDIIPPDKIEKEFLKSEKKVKSSKKSLFSKVLVFSTILLVLILVVGFFFFHKAEIKIKPKTFEIEIEEELTIDLNAQSFDFNAKIMPGRLFEDERTIEREFSATGKAVAEKKATGIITVYNEYSASFRTLIPSRFVSAEGKLFWSTERITIPGYKKQGNKIIPGEKEVMVEAAEPGEDYNIGPSTFALPALAGSSLYTTIYARSFSSMTGGAIGEVAMVQGQDLEKAEQDLAVLAKEESKNSLTEELPHGWVILDQTISQEITRTTSSAEAEDTVDSFISEAEIRSSGFAFKKENMDSFVSGLVGLNKEEKERILEQTLSVSYELKSVNLESGQLVLRVNIKVLAWQDINILDLKKVILGKQVKEAEIFLESLSEISEFEISNKPFLRKKMPEKLEKIKVDLVFD